MVKKDNAGDWHKHYPYTEEAESIDYTGFADNEHNDWLSAQSGVPSEGKLQAIRKGEMLAEQLIAQQTEMRERSRLLEGPHVTTWRHFESINADCVRRAREYQESTGLDAEASQRLLTKAESVLAEFIKTEEFVSAIRHCIAVIDESPEWPNRNEELAHYHSILPPSVSPQSAATPPNPDSKESVAGKGVANQTATMQVEKKRGAESYVTTKRIYECFPCPSTLDHNNWETGRYLADCPVWLQSARMSDGKPGVSALWDPAQFAVCMVRRKHIGKGQATAIIQREFFDWLPEWEEKATYLG